MDISLEVEQEIKYTQERLLGELYAEFLGSEFSSIHIGRDNDSADCLILSNNGPFATLEISRHLDEDLEIASTHMDQIFEKLTFDSENFGQWALTIPSGNNSKRFTQNLVREICINLDEALRSCRCVRHEWECISQEKIISERGLISARKVSSGRGGVHLFLSSEAFMVNQDPDICGKVFAEYFVKPKIIKKLGKLESRALDTRRAFMLTVGSATDRSVLSRMCFSHPGESFIMPISDLCLPANLDEVALVCFGSGRLLHFSHETKWSLFEPDHDRWIKYFSEAFAAAGHPYYISQAKQDGSIREDV